MLEKLKKEVVKFRDTFLDRIYINPSTKDEIIRQFHKLYFDSGWRLGQKTIYVKFMGAVALKCPLDFWIYQELIYELQPRLIIESGTNKGGSAVYLGTMLDLVARNRGSQPGKLISIDIRHPEKLPTHPQVEYWLGSSTSPEIFKRAEAEAETCAASGGTVMVILDSDHSRDHVLKEMNLYSDLVTRGSYMIVEDSNVNGHPVAKDHGPGPMEAIESFFKKDRRFEIDRECERFLMTCNPSGYLKRVK